MPSQNFLSSAFIIYFLQSVTMQLCKKTTATTPSCKIWSLFHLISLQLKTCSFEYFCMNKGNVKKCYVTQRMVWHASRLWTTNIVNVEAIFDNRLDQFKVLISVFSYFITFCLSVFFLMPFVPWPASPGNWLPGDRIHTLLYVNKSGGQGGYNQQDQRIWRLDWLTIMCMLDRMIDKEE